MGNGVSGDQGNLPSRGKRDVSTSIVKAQHDWQLEQAVAPKQERLSLPDGRKPYITPLVPVSYRVHPLCIVFNGHWTLYFFIFTFVFIFVYMQCDCHCILLKATWLDLTWQLKGYTAAHFLREFKTKNWTRGGLKTLLEKIDRTGVLVLHRLQVYVIVWLAVAIPALPVLLATSPLSASSVVILALVSAHTRHTSSINSDNFEMNGVLYKLIEV